MINPLDLTKKLITFKSVTPNDAGSLDYLKELLDGLGFDTKVITFREEGAVDVKNLYATIGNCKSKNICFAGHVDVVSEGDLKAWESDPFTPTIKDDKLFGRGSVDMKSGVACFISAISYHLKNGFDAKNQGIILLITAGEEGAYINGTYKLVKHVVENEKINIDATIVAEPSSLNQIGDSIKVGRRGSMNFTVLANGKQGHVAYHKKADNPSVRLVSFLNELYKLKLDNGNDYFEPSNLEVTAFGSSSCSYNIIPESVEAKVNIRFNNNHSSSSLTLLIEDLAKSYEGISILHNLPHTECFLLENSSDFLNIMSKSITKVTSLKPSLSTSGGTSDAAYIKDYCSVLEFGLKNRSLHEVNENVDLKDIDVLTEIYQVFLKDYFA